MESREGFGLVKGLAELELELRKELEEAGEAAARRIADAREEAHRIRTNAEDRIRRLEEEVKARTAAEVERISQEAGTRAAEEAERIRREAEPNLESAVEFILSEILP